MNKTEENIEDNIPKEVDTDTSLNDINIDIEQSDDEESTMISMYAGKEEVPDISRITRRIYLEHPFQKFPPHMHNMY